MAETPSITAFCLAGTHSGAGKTTVTLGLLAALKARGIEVQPFKCGPDYLDPGHHAAACGVVSRNLDAWMMGPEAVQASFSRALAGKEAAVVEGVMGLFDGALPDRLEGSTAEIALLLDLPVVLVIDVRAMAGSAAALVKGFVEFVPELKIIGVIANRVGSVHHREIIARALAAAGLPPLIGALPKGAVPELPERHLGLVSAEAERDREIYQRLGAAIEEHIDLDLLLAQCHSLRPRPPARPQPPARIKKARLGLARDRAFQFYYADNLDLLAAAGIELVEFSPLADPQLPAGLDGLYLGGGYPELYAAELSANQRLREEIAAFAAAGGAIYAECGGLMYLSRELVDLDGRSWPMCGILELATTMGRRRFRLGYVEAESRSETIFGPAGTRWRGHQFHWSEPDRKPDPDQAPLACRRPREDSRRPAGYRKNRVLATYIHAHFGNNPEIANHWRNFLTAP